jgi:hypothetical protein
MQKPAIFSTLLLVLLISCTACALGPKEYGILEGQVSIGPLVPVIREGEQPPTPAPEVYAAREIVVFKANGVTEFTRLQIDSNGRFQTQLPVGAYVIDINRIGIDSADNLPLEITILANQTTTMSINIDTGIR